MRIAVIQHEEISPLDRLGAIASELGIELKISEMWKDGRLPSDHAYYDGLIVLGGSPSAEDDDTYPHLRRTANLIRHFHANRKPVLALCLGAQLAARAFGAPVRRNSHGEVGLVALHRTPEAADERLLEGIADPIHAVAYHDDSFELPQGAVPLLTNATCPNQGFRLGTSTYAFQPHIEASPERLKLWLEVTAEELARSHPGIAVRVAEEIERYGSQVEALSRAIGTRWFGLARRSRERTALNAGADLDNYW